jgi:hypothetical protein
MRQSAIVAIALASLATTAGAAHASKLMCAIVDVFDCSGKECIEVTSESVGVPDMVRLDTAEKSMKALDAEFGGSETSLESVSDDGKKTTAKAHQGDRSLVFGIDNQSGYAVLTVSDDKVTLVAYGECSSL